MGCIRRFFNHRKLSSGLFQTCFYLLALGDILDGQENDPFLSSFSFYLPGIQQHDAVADGGKIVLDLIVVKGGLLGKDGFQQLPQLGDIPLLVAQIVDQLPHGLLWFHLEKFIEGTADRDHSQVLIQSD